MGPAREGGEDPTMCHVLYRIVITRGSVCMHVCVHVQTGALYSDLTSDVHKINNLFLQLVSFYSGKLVAGKLY